VAVTLAEQVEIVVVQRPRDALSIIHGGGQLILGQDLAKDRSS
jgi:hypothetical protein